MLLSPWAQVGGSTGFDLKKTLVQMVLAPLFGHGRLIQVLTSAFHVELRQGKLYVVLRARERGEESLIWTKRGSGLSSSVALSPSCSLGLYQRPEVKGSDAYRPLCGASK